MANLLSVFPNFFSGEGIFSEFGTVPWGLSPSFQELDTMFFSDFGTKQISPLIGTFLISTNTDILSDSQRLALATMVKAKFLENWTKRFSAISASYDAYKNINLSETESEDEDSTIARTGTVSDSGSQSSTVSNKIYGFDSVDGVPSSSGVGSGTDSNIQTNNLTDTTGKNVARSKTKIGVDGATSSQELIEKEIELRKWNYFDSIFSDISSVLCIPLYDSIL
jgi:hypothetical protein